MKNTKKFGLVSSPIESKILGDLERWHKRKERKQQAIKEQQHKATKCNGGRYDSKIS